jgi:hypothetical protein
MAATMPGTALRRPLHAVATALATPAHDPCREYRRVHRIRHGGRLGGIRGAQEAVGGRLDQHDRERAGEHPDDAGNHRMRPPPRPFGHGKCLLFLETL